MLQEFERIWIFCGNIFVWCLFASSLHRSIFNFYYYL